MAKTYTTATHDYWEIEVTAPHHRLAYAFCITDFSGNQVFYTDQGIFEKEEDRLARDYLYFRMPYFKRLIDLKCQIG